MSSRRTRIPDFDRDLAFLLIKSLIKFFPRSDSDAVDRHKCAPIPIGIINRSLVFLGGNKSTFSDWLIPQFPDFDRPVARSRDNLGPVRGKRDRHDPTAVRVCLLAQLLQFACQTSQQALVLAKEVRFEGKRAPESHTLIVPSSDPETILVPSGENATELMQALWAFVFSLNSSSLSARQASRRQFWPRRGDFELAAHRNPRL